MCYVVCKLTQEDTVCVLGVVAGLSYFGSPADSHSLNRSRVHVCVSIINFQNKIHVITVTHVTHVSLLPTVIQCVFSSSSIL